MGINEVKEILGNVFEQLQELQIMPISQNVRILHETFTGLSTAFRGLDDVKERLKELDAKVAAQEQQEEPEDETEVEPDVCG